jgi:hypothetical protein
MWVLYSTLTLHGLSLPKHHVLNPYHRLKDLFVRFFALLKHLLFFLRKDLHRYNMPSKCIKKESYKYWSLTPHNTTPYNRFSNWFIVVLFWQQFINRVCQIYKMLKTQFNWSCSLRNLQIERVFLKRNILSNFPC